MNEENIQNELKEIGKKLDGIRKDNEKIQSLLTIIIVVLIIFVFMSFLYFSDHFPPM